MAEFLRFFPELAGRHLRPDVMGHYFQAAWAFRREVFEHFLAQGETSLSRLLSLFLKWERDHKIVAQTDDGSLSGWLRYEPSPAVSGLDRLETWTQGVLRGQDAPMLSYVNFDIAGMLADLAEDVDTIFELGSGYGLQLFNLYLKGGPAQARYVGGEVWESGRALADRLAAFEPGLRYESVAFDLNAPDWSALRDGKKALIFTCWSIMYATPLPDDFFAGLLDWPGEATLVFCEPVGFQWGASHPMSKKQADVSAQGGLNGNLARLLSDAAARGDLEPLVVVKDVFARGPDTFGLFSVVVCHKAARSV